MPNRVRGSTVSAQREPSTLARWSGCTTCCFEPRTPISSLPFTISTSGSYYLTKNLSVATGDGITISVATSAMNAAPWTPLAPLCVSDATANSVT